MALKKFIKDSYEELRKVNWPSRKDTFRMVLLVIVFAVIVSLLLFSADSFFTFLMKKFILKI
ncbi:MAG TPA: preprotein translocase subunit SecE [Candidatus Colwellbacteria bacterium]|nr:preprotein translocase subunit SecE [Candidatus Colwellbacteria bacterium]HQA95908.1 preprotein translocase subunit SecE [Candidatus Colwellbacteria bacterium]